MLLANARSAFGTILLISNPRLARQSLAAHSEGILKTVVNTGQEDAEMSDESENWRRIEAATEFQARDATIAQESLVVDAVLQSMFDTINSIKWKGNYANPGSRIRGIMNVINSGLRDKNGAIRADLVTIEGKSVIPNFPTEIDLETIKNIGMEYLEAWLIALTHALPPSISNSIEVGQIFNSPKLFRAYTSAIAYMATKESFISISEKEKIEITNNDARKYIENLSKLETNVEEIIRSLSEVIEKKSNKLDNIIERAIEFAKYKELDKYFDGKRRNHRTWFVTWLLAFFVMLTATFITVFKNWVGILTFLPAYHAGEFEIGKSVVLAAVILGVVWALRVFMRFCTLHLRLSEDASNRTVLIRTLAALEAENDGKIDKEARLIAYNAIFRSSLPDQGDVDVALPTIADLAGMIKGKH